MEPVSADEPTRRILLVGQHPDLTDKAAAQLRSSGFVVDLISQWFRELPGWKRGAPDLIIAHAEGPSDRFGLCQLLGKFTDAPPRCPSQRARRPYPDVRSVSATPSNFENSSSWSAQLSAASPSRRSAWCPALRWRPRPPVRLATRRRRARPASAHGTSPLSMPLPMRSNSRKSQPSRRPRTRVSR